MQDDDLVSVEQLKDFMTKNYQKNVWKNGIKHLKEIVWTIRIGSGYYDLDELLISKSKIEGEDCLKVKLISNHYYSLITHRIHNMSREIEFFICRKNDKFYIMDDKSDFSFSYIKKKAILSVLNCSKLYDYYMKNGLPCRLVATYNYNNKEESVPINISDDFLQIDWGEYNISCCIGLNDPHWTGNIQLCIDESNRASCINKLNELFATIPNLKVKFEDLPPYIQENFEEILAYEEENKDNKVKRFMKNLFKKN